MFKFLIIKTKRFFQKKNLLRNWFFCILLFLPKISFAANKVDVPSFGSVLGNAVFAGLSILLYVVFKFFSFFLYLGLNILDSVISGELFNKIFFSSSSKIALSIAWGTIRDFFNLFFILLLIFIAISIILGINRYNDKKNVLRIIAAALLINFSKVIAMFFIDVSQLFMTFFAHAISQGTDSFTTVFADKMSLSNAFDLAFNDGASFFISLLFATFFVGVLAAMIIFLSAALVVRLVSFWVLTVLSPIAVVGFVLPSSSLSSLSKNWFNKLFSWAFFGPIMMFFLWIALVIISAISQVKLGKDVSNIVGSGWKKGTESSIIKILDMAVPFISAIYLLYYGYDQSKKLSQGAAQSVLNWGGGQINKWSKGTGKFLASPVTNSWKVGKEAVSNKLYEADPKKLKLKGVTKGIARRMTKKGREDVHKERVAKWSGGDHMGEMERDSINDDVKKLKDKNIGFDEVREVLNNKNASESSRRAAAIRLAKEGKIQDGESYKNASELIGGIKNEKFKNGLINELAGKNIYAKFSHERKPENLGENKAREELNKKIGKVKFQDVAKLDTDLLKDDKAFQELERKFGRDALDDLVRKGRNDLSADNAEVIRNQLLKSQKIDPIKTSEKRKFEHIQRDLRVKNQKEINRNFPE